MLFDDHVIVRSQAPPGECCVLLLMEYANAGSHFQLLIIQFLCFNSILSIKITEEAGKLM
jgi:hypothetical protein